MISPRPNRFLFSRRGPIDQFLSLRLSLSLSLSLYFFCFATNIIFSFVVPSSLLCPRPESFQPCPSTIIALIFDQLELTGFLAVLSQEIQFVFFFFLGSFDCSHSFFLFAKILFLSISCYISDANKHCIFLVSFSLFSLSFRRSSFVKDEIYSFRWKQQCIFLLLLITSFFFLLQMLFWIKIRAYVFLPLLFSSVFVCPPKRFFYQGDVIFY